MALRRSVAGLLRNANRAMVYVGTQHPHPHHEQHLHHHHHHHYSAYGSQGLHVFLATLPGPPLGLTNFSTEAAPSSEDPLDFHNEEGPPAAASAAPALSNAETRKLLKLIKVRLLQMPRLKRHRAFLEPDKVAELLAKTMPFHLASENDPRIEELAQLQKEKEEIDRTAQKQVRKMLWGALGGFTLQSAIFFRLTFWDLSWDVMEPITFFVTSSSLLAGFFFFVLTHRDPSYHDLMNTLLSNKQQKLMKKKHFNVERFKQLQVQCCVPNHENQVHARH
ncbi:hypothetical protein GOP47_0002525 [Adiantum capillus-veneris]|uniref:Calcium uniporter protein C-terminal domain-containing protein n=1 Tax=Adiantum capillus-veneris TaxID=13818 RepID=A0A9D4VC86_ADICA|nr:hypothetical protein GOP47_0002525 [Adiantum capillus-veneris]